jgi:tetratricopeptide (TPR) repeat protein
MVPYQQQAYDDARRYWEEALHMRRALGETWGVAGLLDNLALIAVAQDNPAEARQLIAEAVAMRRQLGDQQGLAITLGNRARLALLAGDWAEAAADYRESLQIAHEIGDQIGCVFALTGIAAVWAANGQYALAAQSLAAAEKHLTYIGGTWESDERALYDQAQQQVIAGLSPAAYDAAWQAGCSLTLAAAVALTATLQEVYGD